MGKAVKAVIGVVLTVVGFVTGNPSLIVQGAMMTFSALTQKDPKKGASTNADTENRLSKRLEPETFRKIIFGETAAGLDLRYWEVWGTNNMSYDEVLANATHRITSYGDLYLNDELAIPSGSNAGAGKFAGVFSRNVCLQGVTGVKSVSAGAGAKWGANSSLTGVAHMSLRYVYSQEKWPQNIPSRYTQVVKGAPVYDPRRDVSRGGTHVITDQSTWEYLPLDSNGKPIGRNNALQVLWYLIGWRINGKLVAGRGVDPSDLNLDAFIVAANDCETMGWYSDCILSTGDSHSTNESILSSAAGGQLLDTGGRYSYRVAVDDTANIAAYLNDDHIVGGVQWTPKLKMSDQFNEIAGTFVDPSPTSLYQPRAFPMVWDQAYYDADGFKRRRTINFGAVQDPAQAQKLARIELNRGRVQGRFTATFNYAALQVENWSLIRLTFSRYGWTDKLFRVIEQAIAPTGGIVMTLQEESASVYLGGTVVAVPPPSAGTAYNAGQKIAVGTVTATAQAVSSAGLSAEDGARVQWPSTDGSVKSTQLRYRKATDASWTFYDGNLVGQTEALVRPLLSGTLYEFQVRHISINDILGDWSSAQLTTASATRQTATQVVYPPVFGEPTPVTVNDLRPAQAGADVTGSNTALNTVNVGTRTAAQVVADISAAGANLTLAVSNLNLAIAAGDAIVDAAVDAVEARVTDVELDIDDPSTGLKVRVGSVESTGVNHGSRISVVETSINTPTTGLLARAATLELANADLLLNKADASRVTTLEAAVNTPTTGILARTTAVELAAANLLTGKADASRATALETSVNTPVTGLLARATSLETATSNLLTGKADASRVTTLEAAVTGLGVGRVLDPTGSAFTASPATPTAPILGAGSIGQDTAGYYITASVATFFADKSLIRVTPGRTYEVKLQAEQLVSADSGRWRVFGFNAAGAYIYTTVQGGTIAVPVGEHTQTVRVGTSSPASPGATLIFPAGTVYARVAWQAMHLSTSGASARIRSLTAPQDVTELASAAASITSLDLATASLSTGKADASRVTTLEAAVTGLGVGRVLDPTGSAFTASPATPTAPILGAGSIGQDTAGYYITASVATFFADKSLIRVTPGRTYEVKLQAEQLVSADSGRWRVFGFNAAGAYIYTTVQGGTIAVPVGEHTQTVRVGTSSPASPGATLIFPAGTVYARVAWQAMHLSTSGASARIRSLTAPQDVTELASAAASITSLDLATASLSTGKADASRVTTLEATVNTAGTGLTARLTTEEAATVDLYGRTRARWAIGAAVPGATAFIEAQAETTPGSAPTSSVAIGARQFAVYNPTAGDWKKALEVINGNVVLTGGLQAGAFIRLGNGAGWPVALKAVDFTASDGEVVSFGTDLGVLPSLSFAMNNLAALSATGEVYNVYAEGLTSTGFTLRAKINIPATTAQQTVAGPGTVVTINTYPGRYVARGALPDTADGTYRVQANGTQDHRITGNAGGTNMPDNESYVSTLLNIYALKGGTWQHVATAFAGTEVDPDDHFGDFQTVAATWFIDEVVTVGTGATQIAVVRVSSSNGQPANVSAVSNVSWQSQGSGSGVRTATPSGQKTRITVRPQ